MGDTSIEWTDKVWNPVTGCSKVSQGCKNCYAERVFARFNPERKFTDVRCHEDRLGVPLKWRKPVRVFVNSMSDLFHEDVPVEFLNQVWTVFARCPQHTFQVLTKRPERMKKYLDYCCDEGATPLPNVWLGVSVEDQKTADERIPMLLQTPAMVRWISAEPLLGPIRLDRVSGPTWDAFRDKGSTPKLDWVVVGGESGPGARPMHPEWARSLREQCQAAGVKYFFKQWGEWSPEMPAQFRPEKLVHISGTTNYATDPNGFQAMYRVGKSAAGRLLDGSEWNEWPERKVLL